jgi:hypothetical protein
MERMKKQYDTLVQRKSDHERKLKQAHDDLVAVKGRLMNAKNTFRGLEQHDTISISKDDFFLLMKLQVSFCLKFTILTSEENLLTDFFTFLLGGKISSVKFPVADSAEL